MHRRALFLVAVACLVFLHAGQLSARPKPEKNGAFEQAEFAPPDYANGESDTVTTGQTRRFTLSCVCANMPGFTYCGGSMALQVGVDGAFSDVLSVPCGASEGASCMTTHHYLFDTEGTFDFRIVCDEADGLDLVQSEEQYVRITVSDAPACSDGETRPCPLQLGVCIDSEETCNGGQWSGCTDYGPDYHAPEAFCDSLDNDCDGWVDNVDLDGDGYIVCDSGPGVVNELFLTGLDNDAGVMKVFEYRNGIYLESWEAVSSDVSHTSGGGEAGDLTGDGIPEIAVVRSTSAGYHLEVWTLDADSQGWAVLWASGSVGYPGYDVGEIADFDNDGKNELLVTNGGNRSLELYSWDGSGISVESTVRDCGERRALFIAGAGDLDDDGTLEIFFQCERPEDIMVHKFDGHGGYPIVASVPIPPHSDTTMLVDDMEAGDVDGDGVDEMVFCGSTGRGYVVDYDGVYKIVYETPPALATDSFTQTCSVGDITHDGKDDLLVVNKEGAKVYTFSDGSYEEVWVGSYPTGTPIIGASFVGDADNDGVDEFIFTQQGDRFLLFENDIAGASNFTETHSFAPIHSGGTIIVANLDPSNDEPVLDCDDADPDRGIIEICGDGIDNDCDKAVDEDCPTDFCGDGYCSGAAKGETCDLCAADCGCLGPGCRFGCCGDGVCGRKENLDNCPVDCS